MKRFVWAMAVLCPAIFVGTWIAYRYTGRGLFLSLAITFGTIAYHFLMRMMVAFLFNSIMKNRADLTRRWYRQHPWEPGLYSLLGVKRWKRSLPTYRPELFDLTKRSPSEVAQAMCQAELVHETCAALSLVPILFAIPFGELAVFLITSILCFVMELALVAAQRYNRPRMLSLDKRMRRMPASENARPLGSSR